MSALREDARARREAQTEFERPLLIEAGAGTGKTAVLVARILVWTLGPGWERRRKAWTLRHGLPPDDDELAGDVLRRTVAITFTEAAAAEMTARVAAALVALHAGGEVPGLDAGALPTDRDQLRGRAEALVGALGQLGTRTIHSFCRRLLSRAPLDAGLHPDLDVDADGQEQAATVRQVLEESLPAIWDREDLAAALSAGALGPGDLEEAVRRLLSDGVRAEDLGGPPLDAARVARFVADAEERLADLYEAMRPSAAIKARNSKTKALLGVVERARGAIARFGAGALTPDELDEILDRDELRELVKRLREWRTSGEIGKAESKAGMDDAATVSAASAALPLVESLQQIRFGPLDALHGVVCGLLRAAGERLRARGVLTYGDLLRGARDLLVEAPGVAEQVRGEIDQLMVDEFQDTDLLQCEILAALAFPSGDGEREDAPTLFLVGDPKQSIYGWRNADLRAFESFKQRIQERGRVLPLVQNFRSVPAILDEVERAVAPLMLPESGLQPAFERLEPCPEKRGLRGFSQPPWSAVEYWAPGRAALADADDDRPSAPRGVGDANEIEAQALAADLVRLRDEAGVPLGEVAVLVRTITSLEPIVSALRHAGVAFAAERETEFYRRREIVEATALVRVVLDPADHAALVAVLRSPVVGVPDAALAPFWKLGGPERLGELGWQDHDDLSDVASVIRRAADTTPTDVPGIDELSDWPAALGALAAALGPLRREAREGTPERFVEALRTRLLPEATEAARYMGRHRVLHLDRFFRDLVEALDASGGSPAAVAAWLRRSGSVDREHREGRARSLASDAVQVMTIHRAKGLDFRHVYLMQAGKGVGGRPGDKETAAAGRGPDAEWILCNLPSLGHWRQRELRTAVEEAERVRLLYVALTRAQERIVVSGLTPASRPAPNSQAAMLQARAKAAARRLAEGELDHRDADGVRWRWVFDEEVSVASAAPDDGKRRSAAPGDLAEEAARFHALAVAAEEHAARAFAMRASDFGHESAFPTEPDEAAAVADTRAAADRARRVAMAAGTVVHGVLEDLVRANPDRGEPDLNAWVSRSALPGDAAVVLERADAIWQRFRRGPLAERLAALAERAVGAEVPVLLPPGDDPKGPVGFVSGTIDLVYRARDGRFAVVDYKTDAVDGERLVERARGYGGQGAVYVQALQQALDLPEPPRFELWFLQAGVVVDAMGIPLDPI